MARESAGKARISKACEVKTANGGRYIDGVPLLKWGEWRDNSYCGCVTALLNAAGIPATYEEVMGLSGVCFQSIMRDDWDPSGEMPQNGLCCEKNVGDALGVEVYTLTDEAELRARAKESVGGGVPVLLVAGRWEPEWSLACGYANEGGQTKFFGRTYFDYKAAAVSPAEVYTDNGYFYANGFPGWYPAALTRFYDKKRQPIPRKQALKVSLETAVKMFGQQPGETHKFGYDAYDILIAGFELDDASYAQKCRNDQYHIGSLQDARRAAAVYLRGSAGLLTGVCRMNLLRAANIFQSMLDNLLAAVPYEKTTSVFNGSADPVWSREQRRALAAALRTNKELEKAVRVLIAGILQSWED